MKFTISQGVYPQIVCLVLVMIVTCGSACFIRNCPMGGKRSLEEMTNIPLQRKCLRCGPMGLGQCVGPNICCGTAFGCYMNTLDSATCERENDVPTPCEIEGAVCGGGNDGEGRCVAHDLCCNEEGCRLDSECNLQLRFTPDALQYLKRLLKQKVYADSS